MKCFHHQYLVIVPFLFFAVFADRAKAQLPCMESSSDTDEYIGAFGKAEGRTGIHRTNAALINAQKALREKLLLIYQSLDISEISSQVTTELETQVVCLLEGEDVSYTSIRVSRKNVNQTIAKHLSFGDFFGWLERDTSSLGKVYQPPCFDYDTDEHIHGFGVADGEQQYMDFLCEEALRNAWNNVLAKMSKSIRTGYMDFDEVYWKQRAEEILSELRRNSHLIGINVEIPCIKFVPSKDGKVTCYVSIRVDKKQIIQAIKLKEFEKFQENRFQLQKAIREVFQQQFPD